MQFINNVFPTSLILGSALPLCFAGIVISIQPAAAASAAAPVTPNPNPNPAPAAAPVTPNPAPAAAATNTTASANSTSTDAGAGAAGTGKVAISQDEFSKAVTSCYPENKDKYTPDALAAKYKAFIAGLNNSKIETKKEAAMFLAQILHESGGLIYTKEIVCQTNLAKCKADYPPKGPGASTGKDYYGRGYIQLTWDTNYDAASKVLYKDDRLVKDPDQVGDKEEVAWAVSFWFWDTNVHNAPGIKDGKFGAATNAINGPLECAQKSNPKAVEKRNANYAKCLTAFGISDAPDTSGC